MGRSLTRGGKGCPDACPDVMGKGFRHHPGKHQAVAINPAAVLFYKPGLFVNLACALLIIKGGILHIPDAQGQLRIICFHHYQSQPLGDVAGIGQHLPVILLSMIRITGGNEIVNIFVEKSGIPGSHQLFRGGGHGLTRKIGPATGVVFVPAIAAT